MDAMSVWICDVGNTRVKWARFPDGARPEAEPLAVHARPKSSKPAEALDLGVLATDSILVTGSGDLTPWATAWPHAKVWQDGMASPLRTTAKSGLGTDRVANAFALQAGCLASLDCGGNWLVVDVGTCVTLDLWHDNKHRGGVIAPGLQMRLASMHDGTASLPLLVATSDTRAPHLGQTTREAMLAGAIGGLEAEIHGQWALLCQNVPNLGVILTGGDAPRLELRDISPKFADAHLTLKGYHALFQHL